jgi:chorismate mutase
MMVMDMKPKERAKAIAEQLGKSDMRRWPALIEVAIRDAENDIIARLSEKLESQPDPLSPPSAAAIVRELMHRF